MAECFYLNSVNTHTPTYPEGLALTLSIIFALLCVHMGVCPKVLMTMGAVKGLKVLPQWHGVAGTLESIQRAYNLCIDIKHRHSPGLSTSKGSRAMNWLWSVTSCKAFLSSSFTRAYSV